MINNFDNGADLTLYVNDLSFSIGLTPTQIQAITRILGLELVKYDKDVDAFEYKIYTDEKVQEIINVIDEIK